HPPSAVAELSQAAALTERRLRLWPGVVLIALQWPLIRVPGWFAPGTMIQFYSMFMGPMVLTAAVAGWWLLASRLRWTDRLLVLLFCAAAGAAVAPLCDASVAPMPLIVFALPVVTTAWVLWLLLTPRLRWSVRRVGLLAVILLAWGYFSLVRLE